MGGVYNQITCTSANVLVGVADKNSTDIIGQGIVEHKSDVTYLYAWNVDIHSTASRCVPPMSDIAGSSLHWNGNQQMDLKTCQWMRAYYSEALNGPIPRVYLVSRTKDAACMQTEGESTCDPRSKHINATINGDGGLRWWEMKTNNENRGELFSAD